MSAKIEIKDGLVHKGEEVIARVENLADKDAARQVVVSEKKLSKANQTEIKALLGDEIEFLTLEEFEANTKPVGHDGGSDVSGDTKAEAKTKKQAREGVGAEPAADPQFGDLTPELVEWRKANWKPEQFATTYPSHRLTEAGFTHLID